MIKQELIDALKSPLLYSKEDQARLRLSAAHLIEDQARVIASLGRTIKHHKETTQEYFKTHKKEG